VSLALSAHGISAAEGIVVGALYQFADTVASVAVGGVGVVS